MEQKRKKLFCILAILFIFWGLLESFNPFRWESLKNLKVEVESFQSFPDSVKRQEFYSNKQGAFVQIGFLSAPSDSKKEIIQFYSNEFERNGWTKVGIVPKFVWSDSSRNYAQSRTYQKNGTYGRVVFYAAEDRTNIEENFYFLQFHNEISIFGKIRTE